MRPYLAAFRRDFLDVFRPQFLEVEAMVCSLRHRYGGTARRPGARSAAGSG